MRLAAHVPWLAVFLSGFASGAAFLALWPRDRAELGAPAEPAPAHETMMVDPGVLRHDEAGMSRDAKAAPLPVEEAAGDRPPEELGRSAGEVLARLEAAYREELLAETAEEVASTEDEDAVLEAPEDAPATGPIAAAPPAVDPEDVVAMSDPEPPRNHLPGAEVHVSDVESMNVASGSGDVHVGDESRIENLAVLQYLKLISHPLDTGRSPPTQTARTTRTTAHRHPPWPGALTDPNNPWGFDFPPTPLVK